MQNVAYFFVPSVQNVHVFITIMVWFQEGIHPQDCVWPITLAAGLCTTCPGERVLRVIRFNVTSLALRPRWEKCVPVSWTIQKVQQCVIARFDAVRLFIGLPVFVLILWTLNFTLWLSAGRYSASLKTCAGHDAFVLHQALAKLDPIS